MKKFIHDDFLLQNDASQRLFHEYAKNMPIVDYHCHLNPQDVADDVSYENITQVWLYGDHYKWRAMRSNGISEEFCTGSASDREKFNKFAETMPYLLRNPIYHWSHLELARYFGIDDLVLCPETADEIWERTKDKLQGLSARKLMQNSNVVLVCTTDDPVDSLEHHVSVANDKSFNVQMLPTWRPDKAMAVESPTDYNDYLDNLASVSGVAINSYSALLEALIKRHDHFHSVGCRLSDHGLSTCYADDYTDSEISSIFDKIRSRQPLAEEDISKFKSAMLIEFGKMDAEKGWTKQLHFGPMRSNNTRMLEQAGPDTGFDSIGDWRYAEPLSGYLDKLNMTDELPKTILYNLNPRDNEMLATMLGNFQDGITAGKMQLGSGWWFLDQMDGMKRQIEALSQLGLLRRFVGMLTDSRSFLSYTRHEYFRRILCDILGQDMAKGFIPDDFELVGKLVEDVCYKNAATYFGFDLKADV